MTKTAKRMVRVTLQLSEENFTFARAMADRDGYFGAADYLHAVLNMALLSAMEEEDWPPGCGPAMPGPGPDDDIPF